MSAPFKNWTVLPHGPLKQIDDKILTTQGTIHMPVGEFARTMSIVRLNDGDLVIYSAVALNPEEMAQVEAFGRPAFLIVPTPGHRQDALIWKQRYPHLQVIAPRGAKEKVEEILPVDATEFTFSDPGVRMQAIPGTDEKEAALLVDTANGTTLIVADIIGNMRNGRGFKGFMLRLMGFTGDKPLTSKFAQKHLVKDKPALAAQLRAWAGLDSLRRVIVGHGKPIEGNARIALMQLALTMR